MGLGKLKEALLPSDRRPKPRVWKVGDRRLTRYEDYHMDVGYHARLTSDICIIHRKQ